MPLPMNCVASITLPPPPDSTSACKHYLDAASIEAVWAMHASVKNCRLVTNDEHTSVLAAMEIIYMHQQPADDASPAT
jgi:hypothetical protein